MSVLLYSSVDTSTGLWISCRRSSDEELYCINPFCDLFFSTVGKRAKRDSICRVLSLTDFDQTPPSPRLLTLHSGPILNQSPALMGYDVGSKCRITITDHRCHCHTPGQAVHTTDRIPVDSSLIATDCSQMPILLPNHCTDLRTCRLQALSTVGMLYPRQGHESSLEEVCARM